MSNDLTQDKTQKTIKKTPLDEGGFLIFMTKCTTQVAIAWCYSTSKLYFFLHIILLP
jgi:hypothetical protein